MKSEMNVNPLFVTIIVALIVGGAGFFGGMKYQQGKQPSAAQLSATRQRGMGAGGNRAGYRPVSGVIISNDTNTITVKLNDGSSKIVLISAGTVINRTNPAQVSDLKSGDTVAVFGQTNADGSVSAQNIQLNPTIPFGMMGGRPSPSASPSN